MAQVRCLLVQSKPCPGKRPAGTPSHRGLLPRRPLSLLLPLLGPLPLLPKVLGTSWTLTSCLSPQPLPHPGTSAPSPPHKFLGPRSPRA